MPQLLELVGKGERAFYLGALLALLVVGPAARGLLGGGNADPAQLVILTEQVRGLTASVVAARGQIEGLSGDVVRIRERLAAMEATERRP